MAGKSAKGGRTVAGLVLAGLTAGAAGAAEPDGEQPLWEIGAVGGGGWLPDYPAASQNHARAIALPYAVYRGEFLRLGDRGAARGIVYDDRRGRGGSGPRRGVPGRFRRQRAREGMDDLDYLLELGPRVRYRFLPEPDGRGAGRVAGRARGGLDRLRQLALPGRHDQPGCVLPGPPVRRARVPARGQRSARSGAWTGSTTISTRSSRATRTRAGRPTRPTTGTSAPS